MTHIPHLKGQQIYALIVLLGFTFILFQSIDPAIICFIQESVPDRFMDGFHHIGGINDVMAMHIISLFNFKEAGFVVLLTMVGLFFLSLQTLFGKLRRHPYFLVGIFTIALSLLFPLFEYTFSFTLTSSIVFSTWMIVLGFFISYKISQLKWLPVSAILLLNYFLFGVPGFYLSCIIAIIHHSTPKYQKLLFALLAIAIPALSLITGMNYTFQQAYSEPFVPTIYHKVKAAAYAIYVLTPLVIILLRATEKRMDRQTLGKGKKVLHRVLQYGIPVLLSVAVFHFSYDIAKKEIYQIEVYAQQKNWQGVLKNARHFQYFNSKLLHFQTNRALYHQGILLDHLFQYPQPSGIEGLFLDNNTDGSIAQPKADFYFEMGYGNESRHFANEALITRGNRPHTLKCLIINYAAAGQFVIATKYWNLLNQSIAHKKWAKDHAGLLQGEIDNDIQRLKGNFPEHDFFTGLARPENKLKRFFISNPQNKMAFEYLVANYLITHKVGNVANEIPTFKRLGYTRLPRLVEEAMLLYLELTHDTEFDFQGYQISKEALQDFKDFSLAVQKAGGKAKAKNAVQAYNHTFWYYIMYNSPLSRTEKQ
ncbi:MAG: DUF6057 family protein [Bacteroidota bacterium]